VQGFFQDLKPDHALCYTQKLRVTHPRILRIASATHFDAPLVVL
jgi:hypothetical protein